MNTIDPAKIVTYGIGAGIGIAAAYTIGAYTAYRAIRHWLTPRNW